MYKLIKPFLFMMSPEKAHGFTIRMFKILTKLPGIGGMIRNSYTFEHPDLETNVLGLKFKNPVGLAAGFDKNGEFLHEFSSLGFGFIEIGTVTPHAQDGNPKPRLFRLPKDEALINRMGFNNRGATAAKHKLQKRPKNIIIGGNIGTTITAFLASLGTHTHAKRAAYGHMIFNVLGVVLVIIVFHVFVKFVIWVTGGADPGGD